MNRIVLLLCLALGGCTSSASGVNTSYASLDQLAGPATTGSVAPDPGVRIEERRSPSRLTILFPSWLGRASSGRADLDDGYLQRLSLGAGVPGAEMADEAELRVRVGGAAPTSDGTPSKPTEGGIRAELADKFPGVDMKVVTRPARNLYGPYGLAVGRRADGAGCLYAWQWLDGPAAQRLGPDVSSISMRVRLCRTRENLDALASAINGLRYTSSGAPRAEPTAVRPRRERVARERKKPDSTVLAADAAPALDGRVYLADPPASVAPSRPVAAASPGLPGFVAPALGSAPKIRSSGFDPSLPPEAFRGPTAVRSVGGPGTPPLPTSR